MSSNDHHDDHEHHGPGYWKVYWILLVLFVISVLGPEMAKIMDMSPTMAKATVLITAFGIAFVKAYYVIAYFMHLKTEIKYVQYMLGTTVIFMCLFFFAVAPDVMRHDGSCIKRDPNNAEICLQHSWVNSAAAAQVQYAVTQQNKAVDADENSDDSDKISMDKVSGVKWSSVGLYGNASPMSNALNAYRSEKESANVATKNMHSSYWYIEEDIASNQLQPHPALHIDKPDQEFEEDGRTKKKNKFGNLVGHFQPIEMAMVEAAKHQGQALQFAPGTVAKDPNLPSEEDWLQAEKTMQVMERQPSKFVAFKVDPQLAALGKRLYDGTELVAGKALPCNGCHGVEALAINAPKAKAPTFYGIDGRWTLQSKQADPNSPKRTVQEPMQADFAYFSESIIKPNAAWTRNYPIGGMSNVYKTYQMNESHIEALYHYVASLK